MKDLELSCLNEKQRAAVTSILDASSCKVTTLLVSMFSFKNQKLYIQYPKCKF